MKNKRIGLDGKRALHNFRGLGNYSRGLIEGLLTYYPDNEYILFSPAPKDERAHAWLRNFPQLKVVTPGALGRLAPSLWRSLFLKRVIGAYKLDLFHGLSHELPPGELGCKSIVTIHDLIYLRYPEFFPWLDRQVYNRKFRSACRKADLVLAICEQTKRDLVEFFKLSPERIAISYQSVHPQFSKEVEEAQIEAKKLKYNLIRPYFLYVGALEGRKNVSALVRAYGSMYESTGMDLVLVGRGSESYEKELRTLVQKHNLAQRVHFLAHLPHGDLPALYQGAFALCFPSFFEGFGLPIVEALFSGTPVITSKGSCFPESGGPGTWYVDPHSVLELAAAMKELTEDFERHQKMVQVGLEYAQRFTLEATTKDLVSHYEQVLGPTPR